LQRLLSHSLIFVVFLSLWTWKLLEPHPVPEDLQDELNRAGLSFVAAKSLHAAGYAFLTILAATLPAPQRWRYFLVGMLVLHGVATEIGQTFVPNRTGRVYDVLIDWVGITAGVGLVWWWGRRKPPKATHAN
jgi:VanZ family protein